MEKITLTPGTRGEGVFVSFGGCRFIYTEVFYDVSIPKKFTIFKSFSMIRHNFQINYVTGSVRSLIFYGENSKHFCIFKFIHRWFLIIGPYFRTQKRTKTGVVFQFKWKGCAAVLKSKVKEEVMEEGVSCCEVQPTMLNLSVLNIFGNEKI